MGCCFSMEEQALLDDHRKKVQQGAKMEMSENPMNNRSKNSTQNQQQYPEQGNGAQQPVAKPHAQKQQSISVVNEQRLQRELKNKRANVFTGGYDETARTTFSAKKFPKSGEEIAIIKKAFNDNFIFSSLSPDLASMLVDAMETTDFEESEVVIKEGEEGTYYYVVKEGILSISIKGTIVDKMKTGRGFGELALLHNTPRAATVVCNTKSILFRLDRTTFRRVLAQNEESKNAEIFEQCKKVDVFSDLTDDQIHKISDSIQAVEYNAGTTIFRKGAIGDIFYMIRDGKVRISGLGDNFTDTFLSDGDYFGERALITGEPRAATATAETKVSLMAIDGDTFVQLLGPLHDVLANNMNIRVITSIKIFENLTMTEKKRLSKAFEHSTFKKGEVIIQEGEQGDKFYILREGKVSIYKKMEDGQEELMGELQTGAYFGEMAMLKDETRKATITASTDCDCYHINRQTFTKMLGSLHDILEREAHHREEAIEKIMHKDDTPESRIQFQELKNLSILGAGTFGRVYLVQHKETQEVYALKTMFKSEVVAQKQQVNVINEKNVMKACNHPFILRLYNTYKDSKKLYMLLEFVQGGELFSVLHTARGDGVPDASARFYGLGCILGLAHMHHKEIAHRDIKPENCLIDKAGYPKLVDFGFAKVIKGKSFTLCGTPEYLAPELVLSRGHNKAVDYWAFGILIFEMEAGFSPFYDPEGMDQVVICRNIVNGKVVFPRTFNMQAKELVKRLLSREVSNRLGNLKGGVDEIAQNEWFQSIDHTAYLNKKVRAPWVPQVKSKTDTSSFDPVHDDGHSEDSKYIDTGDWDRDF